MRRVFWLSFGLLIFCILGVGYFLWPAASRDAVPGGVDDQPEAKRETLVAVLKAMPPTPDFSKQAEEQLQAEARREAELLTASLKATTELSQSLLDTEKILQNTAATACESLSALTERGANVDAVSLDPQQLEKENVQDSRDVADAVQAEQEASYYEAWSEWFIRLSETVSPNPESERAVEKFQQRFGDITDDAENNLETATLALRQQADLLLSDTQGTLKKQTLFPRLKTWLSDTAHMCGPSDVTLSPVAFQRELKAWQKESDRLRDTLAASQSALSRLPEPILASGVSKMQAATLTLTQAVERLRNKLQ